MTPERQRGGRHRALCAAAFAAMTLLCAGTAQAKSAYACRALETYAALPAVEGADGTFFAIRPELQSHHGMADETIAFLADLSAALAARGMVLVYLPVPTRAQVMAHKLPAMAADLGYDPAHAAMVHVDFILRMREAGLTVADPLEAMRKAAVAGATPFFASDPRPTPEGARILAQAVASALDGHPALEDATRATFTTTEGAQMTLPSPMRTKLQTACQSELPPLTPKTYTTQAKTAAEADQMILVGTDTTHTKALNLAGFLSEATGLQTAGYGVPMGGAFAAISTYLTSDDFRDAAPAVLVWEVPVAASLARFGDQPMRELISAAAGTCENTVPFETADAALSVDLSGLSLTADTVLALDADAPLPSVQFDFVGDDGLTRSRSIYRHAGQALTGRFHMPVSGLARYGVASVKISAPGAFGSDPSLSTCF